MKSKIVYKGDNTFMVLKQAPDGQYNKLGRVYSKTGIRDYIICMRRLNGDCDFELDITDSAMLKYVKEAIAYKWRAQREKV